MRRTPRPLLTAAMAGARRLWRRRSFECHEAEGLGDAPEAEELVAARIPNDETATRPRLRWSRSAAEPRLPDEPCYVHHTAPVALSSAQGARCLRIAITRHEKHLTGSKKRESRFRDRQIRKKPEGRLRMCYDFVPGRTEIPLYVATL
jgi:hypothetical protein